jgi:hypothetical protein
MAKQILSIFLIILTSISFASAKMQTVPGFEIKGEIKDQQGAVIVDAKITIEDRLNNSKETKTDKQGRFEFRNLTSGIYTVRINAEGFGAKEENVEINSSSPHAEIAATLFPQIKATVIVSDDPNTVTLDPEHSGSTMILKEKHIAALPDDPDELFNRLQLMATTSGGMPGGATVTVDGFLVHGRLPSKGSIREIRINADLYSAEYDKAPYKGGRIEIFTKPGAETFHGSGFFNFNDSALNARNAYAVTKPISSTRRYGVEFGGPIVPKKSGYFVNFERREIDEASTINAITLDSEFHQISISQNVLAPMRLTIGSVRFDDQINPANTFSTRYDFNENRLENQGIGGFNLADRGFNINTVEHTFRFIETRVVSPASVNEARLGITFLHVAERAASNAPAILVPGAFSSGGATAQSQLTNNILLEIGDNFSHVFGKHKLKVGFQVFGRLSSDDRTDNFNGTYIFDGGLAPQLDSNDQVVPGTSISISGLEQYRRTLLLLPGGVPTRFSITTGNPSAHVNQWLFSAFAQDEWKLRQNLSVSMGLRYEGQTNPADKLSLAPRFGVAYAADKKQHWILRGRIGMFYTRIPDSIDFDVQRMDGQRQQQILINNPAFPDPFVGGVVTTAIPTIRQLQNGVSPEASLQMQVAVDHQLPHGWTINFNESYSKGWSALRSVNINAPFVNGTVDPLTSPRPLGVLENILQYQSTGRTSGTVTYIGVKQAENRRFNVFAGYLFFHLRSNADSPGLLPQSSFSQAGEFVRPFWQATHRAYAAGTIYLPWKLRASPYLSLASGTPFNITTGIDNNGDGSFTDRPSVVSAGTPGAIQTMFGALSASVINGTLPRNFGTNPMTVTLDLDLARDFALGKSTSKDARYKLTLNVRSSNLLNHVNVTGLNGVLTSPFFDRANSAGPARKIEFGARFSF